MESEHIADSCAKESPASNADELTCAICLDQIAPIEMAAVKGCEHLYCVCCILKWALCKETSLCPQCKVPVVYLYTHRLLDGTVSDYPVEESVVLLKRAVWFQQHIRTLEKGALLPSSGEALEVAGMDAVDGASLEEAAYEGAYESFYEEYDEEEQVEQFFFSSAAGRARVVLGNRRWGENGSVRAGRMFARPVPAPAAPLPSNGKAGKAALSNQVQGGAGSPGAGTSAGTSGSRAAACSSQISTASGGGSCSGAGKQGRRARRNARRQAAADDED